MAGSYRVWKRGCQGVIARFVRRIAPRAELAFWTASTPHPSSVNRGFTPSALSRTSSTGTSASELATASRSRETVGRIAAYRARPRRVSSSAMRASVVRRAAASSSRRAFVARWAAASCSRRTSVARRAAASSSSRAFVTRWAAVSLRRGQGGSPRSQGRGTAALPPHQAARRVRALRCAGSAPPPRHVMRYMEWPGADGIDSDRSGRIAEFRSNMCMLLTRQRGRVP